MIKLYVLYYVIEIVIKCKNDISGILWYILFKLIYIEIKLCNRYMYLLIF